MTTIFTRGQSISFIEKTFGEGRLSNGGLNVSVVCPECVAKKPSGYSKKKLVIRTDNFISHCWVCGYKSRNLVPLLKRWHPEALQEYIKNFLSGEQLTDIEQEDTDNEKKLHDVLTLPAGFQLLATAEFSSEVFKAKKYLERRGIGKKSDLWYWKFGIVEENEDLSHRIIFPSFDCAGKLNYWTARSFSKEAKGMKYQNPQIDRKSIIFNEFNIDWNSPLTLVEGPFDLVKCNQNATCLLGSEFTSEYKLFRTIVENKTPVVLALDPDAKMKALKIAKELSEYDIKVTLLTVPSEKEDVGAMSKEEFRNLYSSGGILYEASSHLLLKIRTMFA